MSADGDFCRYVDQVGARVGQVFAAAAENFDADETMPEVLRAAARLIELAARDRDSCIYGTTLSTDETERAQLASVLFG